MFVDLFTLTFFTVVLPAVIFGLLVWRADIGHTRARLLMYMEQENVHGVYTVLKLNPHHLSGKQRAFTKDWLSARGFKGIK